MKRKSFTPKYHSVLKSLYFSIFFKTFLLLLTCIPFQFLNTKKKKKKKKDPLSRGLQGFGGSLQRQTRDEKIGSWHQEKCVWHVVKENYTSFYYWCYNYSLDRLIKDTMCYFQFIEWNICFWLDICWAEMVPFRFLFDVLSQSKIPFSKIPKSCRWTFMTFTVKYFVIDPFPLVS